ncbi:uncharacterized protein HaLaN_21634 [Haematococcus lacustris]|uniref:Uncharacterized protein n=1 Tax=Haematococcus lacustris TaxID=44745 RepID=A0A699ZYY2_HAELA|nr:uncharacterized protein HaLaN_21634 [Haematococcus lacustris]
MSCDLGAQYLEQQGLSSPEPAVEASLAVLLSLKQSRHTDGIMAVDQFPVNYYTISEVEQWFPDDFKAAFELSSGQVLDSSEEVAWRFTRLESWHSEPLLIHQ